MTDEKKTEVREYIRDGISDAMEALEANNAEWLGMSIGLLVGCAAGIRYAGDDEAADWADELIGEAMGEITTGERAN